VRRRPATGGRRVAPPKPRAAYGKRARPAGRRPAAEGAFSTLLRQSGLQASTGSVLATKSERRMLASTCLYSLYAWLGLCSKCPPFALTHACQLLNAFDVVVAAHRPRSTGTFRSFDRTCLVDFLQNSVQSTQRPLLCGKFLAP